MTIYARLVRLYPADSPREKILDTVMLGSGRFSVREGLALIIGALRARTGADVRRNPGEFARSAVRLSALVLLVYAAAVDLTAAPAPGAPALFGSLDFVQYPIAALTALVLHVVAIVALARGAYLTAATGAVAALIASVVSQSRSGSSWSYAWYYDGFWAAPLAVLLILALLGARREHSSPAGWLLAIVPAISVLPTGAGHVLGLDLFYRQQALVAVFALALAWSFIDARVPLAVAAVAAVGILTRLTLAMLDEIPGGADTILSGIAVTAIPAVALIIAAVLSRRRAVI
ncbi:hypothetical protein [Actinoplanes utahensis]|uniref:Uncharacterized protein n=1 Tax=Actinoplanes utahensis TaxID=1869 RepID=A0A0A6URZ4_ACTUT|nr:hypothetical protein [Actinoplanes utahensis]KHD78206.1 hypothetical protein MB27_07135 [Actinoplanes utahensis]GIF30726.1 hypothetical protein Aut01nite_37120 [Actinoplanes utahensis]